MRRANASSPLRTTTTSPGSTFTPPARPPRRAPRRDRLADRHVALLAPAATSSRTPRVVMPVEVGVDRAPGGAGRGEAILERPAVVELAVPGHVTEGVDVGDGEAVVDEVEAVEHDVGALAVGRERGVVHDRRLRADVARERDRAARPHERVRLRALGGGDQVRGAALVAVAPAPPVVQVLEVPLDAVLRGVASSRPSVGSLFVPRLHRRAGICRRPNRSNPARGSISLATPG